MVEIKNSRHNAFTIVEVLLALVIISVMLAAVAVAFDASMRNYQANDTMIRSINQARQALLRITNDLRNAQAVALVGTSTNSQYVHYLSHNYNRSGQDDPTNSQISLITADDRDMTYGLRTIDGKPCLVLITNDDLTDQEYYVLCENISSITFDRYYDMSSNPIKVRYVTIVLSITDPKTNQTQKTVAAAVVRKNAL